MKAGQRDRETTPLAGSHRSQRAERYETDLTVLEIVSSYSGLPVPPLIRPTPSHKSPRSHHRPQSPAPVCYDSLALLSSFKPRRISPAQKRDLRLLPYRGTSYLEATVYASMPDYPAAKPSLPISFHPNFLSFDSSFESGNLAQAVKASRREYRLVLNFDTQTKGHTQWFYFAVRNSHVTGPVTFHIVNLGKQWSLFSKGLRPLVWSDKSEGGWHRACTGVSYKPSEWTGEAGVQYYQLSFTYTFLVPQDIVAFSHCYPYQYTRLLQDLQPLGSLQAYVRVDQLCETDGHNSCPILTITEDVETYTPWQAEFALLRRSAAGRKLQRLRTQSCAHAGKKAVVLMARVHPGETCSSLILKGAIDFLTGSTRPAQLLRRHYLFRIVPMLNPDGVVYGNTRTSLLGADLNRRWSNPSSVLHPTLYYVKRLIQTMAEEREIALVCDMHGHSTKKKVFLYGCKHDITTGSIHSPRKNALIRLFPLLLSRNSALFSYGRCRFALETDRQATARQVCFRDLGIDRSYTLEASLFGPSQDGRALNQSDYEGIGRELCQPLLSFINRRLFLSRARQACERLRELRGERVVELLPLQFPEGEEVLEMDRREDFGAKEALAELSEFQEELNASYTSEVTDEGTESSDYSDSEPSPDQRTEPVPKKQASSPKQAKANPSPRLRTFLPRSHSPIEVSRTEATRTVSASCSHFKPVSSRYQQLVRTHTAKRPPPFASPLEETLQAIVPASFENQHLRSAEVPAIQVIVARSAGGFRSVCRSREPRALPPAYPGAVRLSRIQSSLSIEKKTIWRTGQLRRGNTGKRGDFLLNTML